MQDKKKTLSLQGTKVNSHDTVLIRKSMDTMGNCCRSMSYSRARFGRFLYHLLCHRRYSHGHSSPAGCKHLLAAVCFRIGITAHHLRCKAFCPEISPSRQVLLTS